MCEFVAGELVLCFPKVDLAARRLIADIREKKIEHVNYIESLEEKLVRLDLEPYKNLEFDFYLVKVPVGEELWKVTYLHFFYKIKLLETLGRRLEKNKFVKGLGRSDYQFTVAPNSFLTLARRPLGNTPVRAGDFTFSSFHTQYKRLLRLPPAAPHNLAQITIAMLDSGVADDANFNIALKRNFVDPSQPHFVTDDNGHGTVLTLIVHDLAPTARFIIYKVADADGRASEWDTLAALATCGQSHIINVSLQFGLEDRICRVCGRESHSSRSVVFENMLGHFEKRTQRPFLVAAAGNYGLGELAFPARFAGVIAIGAINSNGRLSAESNYGYQYSSPGTPDNHFVAPGGDDTTLPPETIGEFGYRDATYWHGTSFATAYASGLVANFLAQQGMNLTYINVLSYLRQNANRGALISYSQDKHGHGLLQM